MSEAIIKIKSITINEKFKLTKIEWKHSSIFSGSIFWNSLLSSKLRLKFSKRNSLLKICHKLILGLLSWLDDIPNIWETMYVYINLYELYHNWLNFSTFFNSIYEEKKNKLINWNYNLNFLIRRRDCLLEEQKKLFFIFYFNFARLFLSKKKKKA